MRRCEKDFSPLSIIIIRYTSAKSCFYKSAWWVDASLNVQQIFKSFILWLSKFHTWKITSSPVFWLSAAISHVVQNPMFPRGWISLSQFRFWPPWVWHLWWGVKKISFISLTSWIWKPTQILCNAPALTLKVRARPSLLQLLWFDS